MKNIRILLAAILAIGMTLVIITGCASDEDNPSAVPSDTAGGDLDLGSTPVPGESFSIAEDDVLLSYGSNKLDTTSLIICRSYEEFSQRIIPELGLRAAGAGGSSSSVAGSADEQSDDGSELSIFNKAYFENHFLAVIGLNMDCSSVRADKIVKGEDGGVHIYLSAEKDDAGSARYFSFNALLGLDKKTFDPDSKIEVYMNEKPQNFQIMDGVAHNNAITEADVQIIRGGYIEKSSIEIFTGYAEYARALFGMLDPRVSSSTDDSRFFTEEYFNTHFVLSVNVSLPSSAHRVTLRDVVVEDGVIRVYLNHISNGGSCDMVSDRVLIGLDRSVFSENDAVEIFVNGDRMNFSSNAKEKE